MDEIAAGVVQEKSRCIGAYDLGVVSSGRVKCSTRGMYCSRGESYACLVHWTLQEMVAHHGRELARVCSGQYVGYAI